MQYAPPQVPIRLKFVVELDYDVRLGGCDFIFNVQAARTARQLVLQEQLGLSQAVPQQAWVDRDTGARLLRLHGEPGPLHLHSEATVDIDHFRADPASISEVRISDLPGHVLPYLYPSRYCESDRLHRFAVAQFGHLWQGYGRVQAICNWVQGHVAFTSNSSLGTTSACDTLVTKQGVCRDFAHLAIALCRAMNIPARYVNGYLPDIGVPVVLPMDFSAWIEVYLSGRWHTFDPRNNVPRIGRIKIAQGRDAADVAMISSFGPHILNRFEVWAGEAEAAENAA